MPGIDGPLKTTGTARYAYERNDVAPRAAYGYVLTSGIAKGRIRSIDIAAAKASPGVLAVVTAESAGKRCVLVITGKGLSSGGVLRDQVPRWLNLAPNRARVLAFDYARQHHGGAGALYVLLKRRRNP